MAQKRLTRARELTGRWITDILFITAAAALYSIGLHCFIEPAEIAAGGVTGIAVVVSDFSGIPVGMLYGLINLPLVILGFVKLGRRLMVRTIIAVALITVMTDIMARFVPVYSGERIISALYGGVLFGLALGVIYLREGTTGGTDILNKIINRKRPHLSLGMVTLLTDGVVVLLAMLYYRNIESGLYAIITITVSAKVLDLVLYGRLEGKLILIFSDLTGEISHRIVTELNRGATLLKASGAYSGKDKNVILCALEKNEYARVKRLVHEVDQKAFIITANAAEVLGEGFGALVEDK